jgi:hypothetical protein
MLVVKKYSPSPGFNDLWRNQVEKKSASRIFALGELLWPFFSPSMIEVSG